jgi:hypothetical protein
MLIYGGGNWALNRSERRKTGTAEMRSLRRVSGYTLTDHTRVHNMTIRNALQIYTSEERIKNFITM